MKKERINKKRRQIKKYLVYIILSLILLFAVLIIMNDLLRNKISLTPYQKDSLKKIFPSDHIESIKFYEGGLLSIGSTRVICKSVYIHPNKWGKYIINNPDSEDAILLMIHETTHTYQGKRIESCIKMSLSSLYAQFIAFLTKGSRSYAYYYPINLSSDIKKHYYNPEQEASIIEDYFYLKFFDGNLSTTNCYDCFENKYFLDNLEDIYLDILNKYE